MKDEGFVAGASPCTCFEDIRMVFEQAASSNLDTVRRSDEPDPRFRTCAQVLETLVAKSRSSGTTDRQSIRWARICVEIGGAIVGSLRQLYRAAAGNPTVRQWRGALQCSAYIARRAARCGREHFVQRSSGSVNRRGRCSACIERAGIERVSILQPRPERKPFFSANSGGDVDTGRSEPRQLSRQPACVSVGGGAPCREQPCAGLER